MNRVVSRLGMRMQGPRITDLHDALAALGFLIADGERSARRFGATTRAAVARFQTH